MKKKKIMLMVASFLVVGGIVFSGCKPPKEKKNGPGEVRTEVKKAEKQTKKEAERVQKDSKREANKAGKEQRKPQ